MITYGDVIKVCRQTAGLTQRELINALNKKIDALEEQNQTLYRGYMKRLKADRKTENSSEKPNNCKDELQTYVINPQEPTNNDKCFECDDFFTCGGQCNKIEDEPMKTTDYCDICKRDMCEDCIADATNPYCVPSHYEINYEPKDEPQTDCQWNCPWK